MNVLCDEVWVSFKSQNRHGQRIRAQEYSGANRIRVVMEEFNQYVYVIYGFETEGYLFQALKSIAFNKDEMVELSVEGRLKELPEAHDEPRK